jgi:predicted enzyme related to lactoylglutathione lyase
MSRLASKQDDPTDERTEMTETSTHITRLHTVAVPVGDQDRALEFYLGKLGFEKRLDGAFGDGLRWLEVAPAGAETTIALVASDGDVPEVTGSETGIRLSTEDAEADHEDLQARGVDVDPEIIRMGDYVPPMFLFRDPDGNRFVVVEQT